MSERKEKNEKVKKNEKKKWKSDEKSEKVKKKWKSVHDRSENE